MSPRRRVRVGLALLAVVAAVGTVWYRLVEGFSVLDALYQTVNTITTVGFGEVEPFDRSGRVFSIVLMLVGVGAAFYTLGAVFEDLVEDQVVRLGRRRMDRRIAHLAGHAVVCGYGRVGRRIVGPLVAEGTDVVVVDVDAERARGARDAGVLVVQGDSTEDDVLREAGVERARMLVISLASDADAISTVLSARVLNPGLRIVARANSESGEAKLLRAGCDRVVNPLSSGAARLVRFALQPAVADFLDVVMHEGGVEYRLEEIQVPVDSPIVGRALGDADLRSATGALVLAVREDSGEFSSNPHPATVLRPGTTLIAIGTREQLEALEGLVAGGR